MRGGAGRQEKSGAEVLAIGDADLQTVCRWRLRCLVDLWSLRDDGEVGTSSQPRRKSPAIVTRLSSGRALRSESLACASRAPARCRWKLTLSALRDREVLQNLGLQGGAESLRLLDAVVLRGSFEFGKRCHAQVLVQTHRLVGAQTGYRQHLQNAGWDFLLPQLLEAWMRPGPMKLGDDIGNGFAYARHFGEAPSSIRTSRGRASPARLSAARAYAFAR